MGPTFLIADHLLQLGLRSDSGSRTCHTGLPQFPLAVMIGSEREPDFDIASSCSPISLAITMYLDRVHPVRVNHETYVVVARRRYALFPMGLE